MPFQGTQNSPYSIPGAFGNVSIVGTDIYMYTSIGGTGGAASVVVDSNTPVQVSAKSPFTAERVPLFHLGGLDPTKQHTITVTHGPEQGYLEIDYFAVIVPDDLYVSLNQ